MPPIVFCLSVEMPNPILILHLLIVLFFFSSLETFRIIFLFLVAEYLSVVSFSLNLLSFIMLAGYLWAYSIWKFSCIISLIFHNHSLIYFYLDRSFVFSSVFDLCLLVLQFHFITNLLNLLLPYILVL